MLRRPTRPTSLTLLRLPPPPPTTPRLCLPSLAQWILEEGYGWSQNRKEQGVQQEGAGAAAVAHPWVRSGDTFTSHTPPRTSPLCLFLPQVSWLQVSEHRAWIMTSQPLLFYYLCQCYLKIDAWGRESTINIHLLLLVLILYSFLLICSLQICCGLSTGCASAVSCSLLEWKSDMSKSGRLDNSISFPLSGIGNHHPPRYSGPHCLHTVICSWASHRHHHDSVCSAPLKCR